MTPHEHGLAPSSRGLRALWRGAVRLLDSDYFPEGAEAVREKPDKFDWSRCLHDQMFVFQENELDRILDIIVTKMTPQRSPTQKPVPANWIFLSARYAYYHSSPELLE